MTVTIVNRKKMKESRMRSKMERVKEALASYVAGHVGRFVVFGSAARDEMRYDSDLDILVDFPAEVERDARDYAERVCIEHGIKPDLHLASEASSELLDRVSHDGALIR